MTDDELFQLIMHRRVLFPTFSAYLERRVLSGASTALWMRAAGLAATRIPEVLEAFKQAKTLNVLSQDKNGGWAVRASDLHIQSILSAMRGATLFEESCQRNTESVQLVISKPPEPSQFIQVLEDAHEGLCGIAETERLLGQLASRAVSHFTIMTPFIDEDGAQRVIALFEAADSRVSKVLILRQGAVPEIMKIRERLVKMGVQVFEFRIPRPEVKESETFHAKVICIDRNECYVGSSNMTKWSFSYSLEMGFYVTGASAARVASILDSVQTVSKPVRL